jgi:signal transduction histidine kinase
MSLCISEVEALAEVWAKALNERILIVDDEESTLAVLRLALERDHYRVVESTSALGAIDVLRQSLEAGGQPIDLVLLDIMLPDLSGLEVCRILRSEEAFAHLPVLVLTALSSVTDRLLAFDAGADDFLVKPVDSRELLARLQVQLRLRRAERDAQRRNRELAALHLVSEVLNHSVELRTMLNYTLAVSCDVLRTAMGAIYLVDDDDRYARLAVSRGVSDGFESHPDIARIPIGERHVGSVAAAGESLVKADLVDLPFPSVAVMQRERVVSAAYVPIKREETVVGVLMVGTRRRRILNAEEVVLLETIGAQLGVAIDRARLHQEVRTARDQARLLARRVVQAQEDERRRIAHELHDQIGQAMTALKLDLEMLRDGVGAGDSQLDARLAEDIAIASELVEDIQTLSFTLRPMVLDDLGLEPALTWYIDRFSRRTGLGIEIDVAGIGEGHPRLPDEVETVAFRCLQEMLTNVARHAHAENVLVAVERRGSSFNLAATDDGVGFDVAEVMRRGAYQVAFGLSGMQERVALVGGTLQIQSWPGQGTQVAIDVPLEPWDEVGLVS